MKKFVSSNIIFVITNFLDLKIGLWPRLALWTTLAPPRIQVAEPTTIDSEL